MSFRIVGLPAEEFSHLFDLPDGELAQRSAVRMIANGPGFPCRISLTDAAPGDEVILVNYEYHRVATPFRASFAIYVRPGERTHDEIDTVPDQLRKRLLSLRAYDARGMMLTADVIDGREVELLIDRMLARNDVSYVHAHFAKPGCYAARIVRA